MAERRTAVKDETISLFADSTTHAGGVMILRIRSSENFGAGALMLVVAGAFLYHAQELSHGTLAQMGPAYMPRYVAGMLAMTGAILLLRGLRLEGRALPALNLRAIILPLLAVVAFGQTIELLGLAISSFAAVMVGALASPHHDWLRMTVIAALLAGASCLLFVTLLDLPLPLLPPVP